MRRVSRRGLLSVAIVLGLIAVISGPVGAAVKSGGTTSGGGSLGMSLQGFDKVSNSWTSGNTAGYAELQVIPFRLALTNGGTPATVNSLDTLFDHCDLSKATPQGVPPCPDSTPPTGVGGVQDFQDFALCGAPTSKSDPAGGAAPCTAVEVVAEGTTPAGSGPYVERHPFYNVSGGVLEGHYTWHRVAIAANQAVTLRWGAKLALGSHAYGGAALHVQIGNVSVSGAGVSSSGKNVPIPVNQIIATQTHKTANGSDNPAPVNVGDTVHFVITSSTFGPTSGTQNITVTDRVPACLSNVSNVTMNGVAVVNADQTTSLTWTFPNVKDGTTLTVAFDAVAASPGNCTNVAVTHSNIAPDTQDDVTITINGVAKLATTKSCTPTTVAPGGTTTCSITFSNSGSATASGATVKDVLDPGLTYNDHASLNGSTIQPTSTTVDADGYTTVLFSVGDIPGGGGGTISYQVTVPTTGTAGTHTYNNTATTYTSTTTSPPSTSTITVVYVIDLFISKSCPASASLNSVVTHTLTYGNHSSASAVAHNVQITDTLDPGLQYQAGSAKDGNGNAVTPTVNGQTLTFSVGTLAVGQGGSISYSVKIVASGPQTDRASIAADEVEPTATAGDNSASCVSGVSFVDVYITKACPSTASPGDSVTHTLSYGNKGNTDAAGVVITDVLTGETYVANSTAGASEPTVANNTPNSGQTTLTFTLGTVKAGSSGTITYQVTVPSTASAAGTTTFSDHASISTTSTDADPSNNSTQPCTTGVVYSPSLRVSKSACPSTGVPGGEIQYTLTYSNNGTAPASSAVLTDTITAGGVIVDAGGGQLSPDGKTDTFSLGAVPIGGPYTKTIVVLVTAGNGGQVSDTATLTSPDGNAQPATLTTPVSNAGAATHGSAYDLDARALGITLLDHVGQVATTMPGGPADQAQTVLPLSVPGLITANVVNSSSQSSLTNEATSTSTAEIANLNILAGAITSDDVKGVSQSTAGPYGATYGLNGSTFTNLRVNGQPVTNVAPNGGAIVVKDPVLGTTLADLYLYKSVGSTSSGTTNSASQSVDMIRVDVLSGAFNGVEVIVGHAQSDATYPSGNPCGVTPSSVSGQAYTAYVATLLQSGAYVGSASLPPSGGSDSNGVADNVPGVVTEQTASNTTSGSLSPNPNATTESKTTAVNLLNGVITADALDVTSASSADGTTAGTTFGFTFVNLVVGGHAISGPVQPNTTIALPQSDGSLIYVVLNEQQGGSDGTRNTEGTVNAIHVLVLKGTALQTEVIVASAHSDAHK